MMLDISFIVCPADTEPVITGLPPGETVAQTARFKAKSVLETHAGDIVLAADTMVFIDGLALGKPRDEADAKSMLKRLSGRSHEVYTGVSVMNSAREETSFERTVVTFRELTGREISRYIKTGEPMDKAGAYGAQGRGAVFLRGIEGDFFNVMGLPLCRLSGMLESFGITVGG
jgi:septum formation protein